MISRNSKINPVKGCAGLRRFLMQKLVRDRHAKRGSMPVLRPLSDSEYDQALRDKLKEEALEVSSTTNREDLIDELADVYEVLESFQRFHHITVDEIQTLQVHKRSIRGGFDKRIYVEYVDVQDPSLVLDYVLQQPDKYPEISFPGAPLAECNETKKI